MLNFAVGESNEIRIAVHDIFIRLSCQWKENTIVLKSVTGNFKHSIPSCELAKVIIESLLEILSISSQNADFSDKVDSTTMSGYKTMTNEQRCRIPISELLLIVFLHAFPIQNYNCPYEGEFEDTEENAQVF